MRFYRRTIIRGCLFFTVAFLSEMSLADLVCSHLQIGKVYKDVKKYCASETGVLTKYL